MELIKTIVLITSGQPSANPRLVKEATALAAAGYKIKVIYCFLSPWADAFDQQLFAQYPQIQWMGVGYHAQRQCWGYWYARLRRKWYEWGWKLFPKSAIFAWRSLVLFSQELEREAKWHSADLYIGHNLGALPVVVQAARRSKTKAGFDAEDFHRGENKEGSSHWKRCQQVEDEYIPKLNYLSAASPLILKKYQQLYHLTQSFTIRNVFELPDTPIQNKQKEDQTLHLFWFSQTLGRQRGIELAIRAMGTLKNFPIHLHLLGNVTDDLKRYFIMLLQMEGLAKTAIQFCPVIPQADLIEFATQFDIGLATELSWCESRDLCETNKIFTYLLAGLAIAFTNTQAQQQFWQENPEVGFVFKQDDPLTLAEALRNYMLDPSILEKHKKIALEAAYKHYNWQVEKENFITRISQILS